MIQVTNLSKRYGTTLALDNLTLTIPDGVIFGLLGPNGSGKSTLIKLLMEFIYPDAGQISFAAMQVREIGYVPERVAFPMQARLHEYLLLVGQLCNLSGETLQQRVAYRLQQVGLSHAQSWRISACSKGMLQRLALAASLLGDPPLLILDEPMSGLDPKAQHHIRQVIRAAHQAGATILLSTHHLTDVAELCTHIAILNRAHLVRSGALEEVLPWRSQVMIRVRELATAQADQLQALYPGLQIDGQRIALNDQAIAHKAALLRSLIEMDIDLLDLRQQRTSLEEIYLEAIR